MYGRDKQVWYDFNLESRNLAQSQCTSFAKIALISEQIYILFNQTNVMKHGMIHISNLSSVSFLDLDLKYVGIRIINMCIIVLL